MTSADEQIAAFIAALPPFCGPAAIRKAAAGNRALFDAALDQLDRGWVGGDLDCRGHTAVLLVALSSEADALQRFADHILFRVPSAAIYRQLAVLLRPVISDEVLAGWIVGALASDDDAVVTNALDLQYHAYGWPDRFKVSEDQAARIAAAVESLERTEMIAGALERYRPPG